MKVCEIFPSIQGEGDNIGRPAIFVRLAGCNLACPWCDTKESWSGGDKMTPVDIIEKIDECIANYVNDPVNLVVITGGEPTIYKEGLLQLVDELRSLDYEVAIESNGTAGYEMYYQLNKRGVHITVSPKPHLQGRFNVSHLIAPTLDCISELKFVVTPDFDASILERIRPFACDKSIWLQPESSQMKEMWDRINKEILPKYPFCRCGIQLHKLIGVK